jgi:hypothetical protein
MVVVRREVYLRADKAELARVLRGSPQEVEKALSRLGEKWAPALLQNTPFGSLINQHP